MAEASEQDGTVPVGRPPQGTVFKVRIPRLVSDIGLGQVVNRSTGLLGISHCAACERRAATLNRWIVFTGWRSI